MSTDDRTDRSFAQYIKEIGRGKAAARALALDDARAMFLAMLRAELPEIALGAILIALRVKGESIDELRGFSEAIDTCVPKLAWRGARQPVVIPTYNGARKQPNLVALLAMLLRDLGVPVLLHGITHDPSRVTTAQVLQALGTTRASSREQALQQLEQDGLAFAPIDVLAPALARVLDLRWVLGVRNSAHTLVKMMNPFDAKALVLVSVTHPDYLATMRAYFQRYGGDALLMRGTEGEAVANPRRQPCMEWLHDGEERVLIEAQQGSAAPTPAESLDPAHTAAWIRAALAQQVCVPEPIANQAACVLYATGLAPSLELARTRVIARIKIAA